MTHTQDGYTFVAVVDIFFNAFVETYAKKIFKSSMNDSCGIDLLMLQNKMNTYQI